MGRIVVKNIANVLIASIDKFDESLNFGKVIGIFGLEHQCRCCVFTTLLLMLHSVFKDHDSADENMSESFLTITC